MKKFTGELFSNGFQLFLVSVYFDELLNVTCLYPHSLSSRFIYSFYYVHHTKHEKAIILYILDYTLKFTECRRL